MHGCFEGKNVFISYFEEIVQVVQPCKNVTPLMLPRAVRSGIICWGNAAHASQKESFKLTTPIFPRAKHVQKGRLVLFFACWRIPLPVLRDLLSALCCRSMWMWGTIWCIFSLHSPFSSQLKAPYKSKAALEKWYKSYISSCVILLPKELQDNCQKKWRPNWYIAASLRGDTETDALIFAVVMGDVHMPALSWFWGCARYYSC